MCYVLPVSYMLCALCVLRVLCALSVLWVLCAVRFVRKALRM